MKKKIIYSSIEKKINELTPDWILSTSNLLSCPKPVCDWSLHLKFKNKSVKKGSLGPDGKWRNMKTKTSSPDFVILQQKEFDIYKNTLNRFFNGEKVQDPFRNLGCKSGFYIEAFGDYYHSGDFVQGQNKEDHEKEVIEAYRSCNSEVLILWEKDIISNWEEICVPAISLFLSKIPNLPKNNEFIKKKKLNNETILSLSNASYWRNLNKNSQNKCVEELINKYKELSVPKPDKYMAKYDFDRFMKWSKNGGKKGTRFGVDCCKFYCDSFFDAKVKNHNSLRELWSDLEVMKKSILWQFNNENGVHHANRFLNAMCFKSGFRTISILHPSLIVKWIKKYINTDKIKNKIFFDPCAGWGSRMLSAHALGMKYYALDANKNLVDELNFMANELNINARILYGDSSNKEDVKRLLDGEKIDLCFTSPPYFDKEIYSTDKKQSIVLHSNKDDWHKNFIVPMINNVLEFVNKDFNIFFNISNDFNLEILRKNTNNVDFIDEEIYVESSRKKIKERLLFVYKKEDKVNTQIAGRDFVVCEICHKRFKRLGRHVKSAHNISIEEYQERFENKKIICEKESERIKRDNKKTQKGKKYKKRIAYKLPDGSFVCRKTAWKKAWGGNGPENSIVNASLVNLDPWTNKKEGVDYVKCQICGFKGKNIKRHVKREHGLEGYTGPLKSQECIRALSNAANKSWKTKKNKK